MLDHLIAKAGIAHVQITGLDRDAQQQVDAMYPKLERGKVDNYKKEGTQVQLTALKMLMSTKMGATGLPGFRGTTHYTPEQIKSAMLETVNRVRLKKVTDHAPSPYHRAIDVSYANLTKKEREAFIATAKEMVNLKLISAFGWPDCPDKSHPGLFLDHDCFHLTVPRRQENRTDVPSPHRQGMPA